MTLVTDVGAANIALSNSHRRQLWVLNTVPTANIRRLMRHAANNDRTSPVEGREPCLIRLQRNETRWMPSPMHC